jgi:hypothetical protein
MRNRLFCPQLGHRQMRASWAWQGFNMHSLPQTMDSKRQMPLP